MIDGVITESPMISVADDGLLRGDGAFEVLRLYDGVPFAREAHLRRLSDTSRGLRLPCDVGRIDGDIDVILRRNVDQSALLRLILTRAGRRIIVIEPIPELPCPATLACVPWEINPITAGLKTLSYAANALATRIANEKGADLALFVTPGGEILEGPNYSVFFRLSDDGPLVTPPLDTGILDSITRRCVLAALHVVETRVSSARLADVREAFVASTIREILPISVIDGRALREVPGPATCAATDAYRSAVRRHSSLNLIPTERLKP